MRSLKLPEDEADGGAAVSKADTVRAPGVSVSRDKRSKDLPKTLAGGRFILDKKLGEGSFGMVYVGHDTQTNQKVAIKLEHKKSSAVGQLSNESRLMELLSKPNRPPGFAELFYFGKEPAYAILAMDLLGYSLEDSVQVCSGKTMKFQTAAIVAEQGISLLAYLHSKCLVHRDIKSENFMWGIGDKQHHLYIIDFGMSTRYYMKRHVSLATGKQLTGTARYASINAMKGCTQSRRDDLEALAHVLMYALRGHLPWSGLDAPTYKDKLALICKTKETFPISELCKGFPKEFEYFLQHSRGLRFEEKPNYDNLVKTFVDLRGAQSPPVEAWQLEWIGADVNPADLVPLITAEPCAPGPEDTMS